MSPKPFTARDDSDRDAVLAAAFAGGLSAAMTATIERFAVAASSAGDYAMMLVAEAAAALQAQAARLTAANDVLAAEAATTQARLDELAAVNAELASAQKAGRVAPAEITFEGDAP